MKSASIRFGLASTIILPFTTMLAHTASAQNIADNVRPVGAVCLAGQACVGTNRRAFGRTTPAEQTLKTVPVRAEGQTDNTSEVASNEVALNERAAETSNFDVVVAYQTSCNACHGTGAAGAPMLGDATAWEGRLGKGMDALMSNVINGVGAMPARGICMTCSDEDLQTIVDYMLAQN